MNKTAFDLVPFLQGIEAIKASSLSSSDKDKVLAEMAAALPAPVFCKSCPTTLKIIGTLVGVEDASAQSTKKEGTEERVDPPKQGDSKSKQLLHKPNENRRGKGAKKAVVNKKA